jgi:hypothetical protein
VKFSAAWVLGHERGHRRVLTLLDGLGDSRAQQHLTAGAYTSLVEALDHVRIDLALQVE